MTRALVVFESMFGNTELVARAVAVGLAEHTDVDVVRARPGVMPRDDVDLVVVGGPTHAFGLTRRSTRVSAGQQGADEVAAQGTGLREWLDLPPGPALHRPATGAASSPRRWRGCRDPQRGTASPIRPLPSPGKTVDPATPQRFSSSSASTVR
jgi:hypothetical protein